MRAPTSSGPGSAFRPRRNGGTPSSLRSWATDRCEPGNGPRERSDGHTRWCVLKSGADYEASGSDWYADGGPRSPDWCAKFILWCPSLDRCATVGFRAALSL